MILEKITVINWMGYEQKTLEFAQGKNLIFGRNAAGKSSLAKAIAYNLTGNLPKKCDPRRDSTKEAIIDISIKATDGKKYLIRRQLSRGKKSDSALFIYEENKPSEALFTSNKAEEFLEKLLGLSGRIFERVIYMKEEDVHEFLAKPDEALITEIDRLIGLEKATTLTNSLDNLIDVLKGLKFSVEKRRKQVETAVDVKLDVALKPIDVKKGEKELTEIGKKTEDLFVLKGLLEKRETIVEELAHIKQEIGEVANEKLEAKLIEKQLAQEKAKEKIEIKLSENRKKISDLNDTQQKNKAKAELKQSILNILKKMQEEGKISECPTCGREMDEKLAQKIAQKIEEEIKFFQKQIDDLLIKIKDLNELYQKTDREKQQYDRIISELQLKKNGLKEILQELNSNESLIKQLKSKGYPLTLEEIEKQLDKFDEEEKKLNQAIGVARGAELVKKQNIQDLLKEEEGYKHKQKISELIIDAMVKTTKKLREDFMAKVKNQVEDIWKTYKGEKWAIDCDENFVPYAKPSSALRTLSIYEMSGSEKFIILLAIRLAIQQILGHFKLLIIDEPCQHLDEANGRIFRDILSSLDESKIEQSIVLTYNQAFLEGKWSKIIKLT